MKKIILRLTNKEVEQILHDYFIMIEKEYKEKV